MKVLVVGGGGREHTIVWSLAKSKKVSEIFCAPGNGGISDIAKCVNISVMEFNLLADFAEENKIDLTVVGMDAPLVGGIVDVFESRGLNIFGPRKNAAIIEGSKSFSKNLVKKYNIPTAAYESFDNYENALNYVKKSKMPIVIKADGLALGKGVLICKNVREARDALCDIMVEKRFGEAGDTVVIEEFLEGTELSLLCFCDGKTIVPMVSAKDYKRAYDNDEGLNTGGMGTISPNPALNDKMEKEIFDTICLPTKDALLSEGREFKGVIYFGLMITEDGVKVIEYNARFGDPEAQVILPRLKTDLFDIFMAVVNGTLDKIKIDWEDNAVCCVVLASGGYPASYETGCEITGLDDIPENSLVFHAGTRKENGRYFTSGGRVLGVTGIGDNLEDATHAAYNAALKIYFDKMLYRSDIGKGIWL